MIGISTIFRFLFFDSEAILRIAANRRASLVGLLLVISAGFAREYDGEYLLAEPWHVLVPILASLIGCILMVLLLYVVAWDRNTQGVSLIKMFLSFLNVYWMTAPLAWLYAIPFERFMSPADATRANLILLAIVAVWRVALMIRSAQVMFGTTLLQTTFPVLLFSDGLALVALFFMPHPVFMVMGGVRLTESQNIILSIQLLLTAACVGTFLIWLPGCFWVCNRPTPWVWRVSSEVSDKTEVRRYVSFGAWGLTAPRCSSGCRCCSLLNQSKL